MKRQNIYIVAGVAIIAIIWHVIIGASKDKYISGLFRVKPKLGYSWNNTLTNEPRYFWQKTSANWRAGTKHPKHNVIASTFANEWVAMPGYIMIDKKKLFTQWRAGQDYPDLHATSGVMEGYWTAHPGYSFSTNANGYTYAVWTPNIYHPNGKLVAGPTEGQWIPCLGYEWVEIRGFLLSPSKKELRWTPGIKYNDRHVVTSVVENQFIPFPGYQFSDSTRSIDVVWTPGTVNPTNSNLIAGSFEGTWIDRTTSSQQNVDNTQWFEYLGTAILYNEGGKLADRIAGDGNKYSNELYKESLINLIKGGIQLFKKDN